MKKNMGVKMQHEILLARIKIIMSMRRYFENLKIGVPELNKERKSEHEISQLVICFLIETKL